MELLNEHVLQKNIESSIRSGLKSGQLGGVAVAVRQRGELVYEGFFDAPEIGVSVSRETIFRLASMTKPITAVAVLILADRGLVGLHDPVSRYLPAFGVQDIAQVDADGNLHVLSQGKSEITIFHLLTHSSGLGSCELGEWQSAHRPRESLTYLSAAVDYYSTLPLAFAPGTATAYSPIFAFDVLARIAEVVSGMPFDRFLEEELFRPLGMKDTTFAPSPEQWQRMIPLHNYQNGKAGISAQPAGYVFGDIPVTCFAGGAGLASTLDDYCVFAEMLLNQGTYSGNRILSAGRVREMATRQVPELGDIWGLGVRVAGTDAACAPLRPGSFGWSGAYGTHFWVDPANAITAVYMKNSLYDGGAGAATAHQFEQDVCNALSR